jgi:lysozyme family protein
MRANFQPCYAFIRKWEGGNDDDSADPGGRTSRGVEQREWDAFCKLHSMPESDVWTMPEILCTEIYQSSYWNPYCDVLPGGLDLMFFDTSVNEGPREAIIFLQRALHITADGHFGVVTAAAVRAITDVKTMISQLSDERKAHYDGIVQVHPRLKKFLRGWMNRNRDCLVTAQKMVT